MNRHEARELAERVTNDDLKSMLSCAKQRITNWTKSSTVNNGLTIGVAFNIFSKSDFTGTIHRLAKINMLREFGEYLPGYAKPEKPAREIRVIHEEPNEIEF